MWTCAKTFGVPCILLKSKMPHDIGSTIKFCCCHALFHHLGWSPGLIPESSRDCEPCAEGEVIEHIDVHMVLIIGDMFGHTNGCHHCLWLVSICFDFIKPCDILGAPVGRSLSFKDTIFKAQRHLCSKLVLRGVIQITSNVTGFGRWAIWTMTTVWLGMKSIYVFLSTTGSPFFHVNLSEWGSWNQIRPLSNGWMCLFGSTAVMDGMIAPRILES